MNPLKKLVGETAIYGTSTILARIINFLFVPMYTRMLSTADYGVTTEFLSYIAILQVLLILGLETGCFRFANKHDKPKQVFSTALATMLAVCAAFFATCAVFSTQIAHWLGYDGFAMCIVYVGGILAIDCFTAILFAYLRHMHKAVKFAVFKTVKIVSELGFNILFFFALPSYFISHPQSWLLNFISATPDFTYILFAIFLSSVICLLLFIPDLLRIRFSFSRPLWIAMMAYSLPLMIAGLPGVANDFIDRILFRFWAPTDVPWREQLGIFQAGVKLAVLMTLFIQMFRYAAEPFFFAGIKDKNSPKLYAEVMNHFTAFCMVIFLFVLFYIDAIGLLIGKDFRQGIDIVPIMLGAFVLLGITFNLSMWYKLSGKTKFAIYITCVGLGITFVINLLFMPQYGYHAAAWAHFFSYFVMAILSAYLGKKYYPIPYNWVKILTYLLVGVALYFISTFIPFPNLWIKWIVNTVLLLSFIGFWFRWEKISLKRIIPTKIIR